MLSYHLQMYNNSGDFYGYIRSTKKSVLKVAENGLFLEGRSCYGVAKELTTRGMKTPGSKDKWSAGSVKSILTNEKYKGDALLQNRSPLIF